MSHEDAFLAVRTGWSFGTKIGGYFKARKDAREFQKWTEQTLLLCLFVFVISILAISMSDMIRSRMV